MAQIWSKDSQAAAGGIAGTTPTQLAITNELTPPQITFKAAVTALVAFQPGNDQTTVELQIIRNPDAEAAVLFDQTFTVNPTDFPLVSFAVGVTDPLNDPRGVTYQLVATQAGGAASGFHWSYIEATLLSG